VGRAAACHRGDEIVAVVGSQGAQLHAHERNLDRATRPAAAGHHEGARHVHSLVDTEVNGGDMLR
jgi:hypothetical protein